MKSIDSLYDSDMDNETGSHESDDSAMEEAFPSDLQVSDSVDDYAGIWD